MFLNKKKGATPEESRSGLETIAQAHGGTGQKVLAVMVGLGATLVLAVGLGYKYVLPMFSDKPAPVAAAKPVPEVKPAAELNVPLDLDRPGGDDEGMAATDGADDGADDSTYRPLPGLAGDARPSPSGRRNGDRPVGSAAQPLPPGMQGAGSSAAAAAAAAGGYAAPAQAGSDDSPADRKLEGDLGDFGDGPATAAAAGIGGMAPQRRDIHPDCIGIQGGPAVEAECSRRMPPRPAAVPAPAGGGSGPAAPVAASQNGGALASQLGGIQTPNGNVGRVQNPHLTLRKGAGVTCTLDTAISSEQAGFVECVTDYPIYSMDGKVVLAERGTRIVGEYSRDVTPGSRSIFVLWTRASTPAPHHVTFDLFSPGSDRLGRSGIDGDVDNKYWERYSGPLMFSVLQDISTAVTSRAAKSTNQGQGNGVFLLPSTQTAGQNAVAELLKQGSEVKRSLYRNQGDTISITVARYVDFSPVYKLRTLKGRN